MVPLDALSSSCPARNQGFDVVLVDTAGRMQDNAPLMTALAKLIAVNAPDLVLFVGEALVGNEAVDQLVRAEVEEGTNPVSVGFMGGRDTNAVLDPFPPQVKFNKALADHSMAQTPRLIDGIVLTKFDTIDDKVRRGSRLRTELGTAVPGRGALQALLVLGRSAPPSP